MRRTSSDPSSATTEPRNDTARAARAPLTAVPLTITTFLPFGEGVAAGPGLGFGLEIGTGGGDEGKGVNENEEGGGLGLGVLRMRLRLDGSGVGVSVQKASDDEVVAVKPFGHRARHVSGPPTMASLSPQAQDW